jgi:hypothetical protein
VTGPKPFKEYRLSVSAHTRRLAATALAAASLFAVPQAFAASLTENFDVWPATGWVVKNTSEAPNEDWSLGNPGASRSFSAHQGAANSYAASSFNATFGTTDSIGDISNWLITPAMVFNNGDTLSFWTRAPSNFDDSGPFPDAMQLRFSLGSGTDVGSGLGSVGTFTQQLLFINPQLVAPPNDEAYPITWTQYAYTFSGLAGPTEGRLAFRHVVPQGGPGSVDSDYIGIDTVQVTAVPEPSAYAMAAIGLIMLGAWSRRRSARHGQG